MDKPESSYDQDRLIAKQKENEKFQEFVHVNYKLEELIYLVGVMNSVTDEVFINQNIFNDQ